MNTPMIQIGNETRPMTDAEYSEWLTHNEEIAAQQAANNAKIAARQTVLAKLGLTADEAAALFG